MRVGAALLLILALEGVAAAQPAGPDPTSEIDRCAPRAGVAAEELRRRALEHYNRGAVYYEQGDYDAAVDEFVASYCDAPSPQTFFNIGQAYERLLEYDVAVAYFARFLREAAPDARNVRRARVRIKVLRRLPARIRVATVPEGARVSMLRDNIMAATGRANGDTPIEVHSGDYTLRVELDGYQTIERHISVSIGQPYSYYFQLEKKRGTLRVQVSPKTARVFIGDRLVGVGGHTERVPIGRYQIRVEADKREPKKRRVEVTAGRTTDVVIRLEEPEKTGRWQLIAAGTVMGLFAGGASLGASDLENRTKGLIALGGGALALGGALIGVPKDIRLGSSSFIITSALAGTIEAAAVSSIFLCSQSDATGVDSLDCNPPEAVSGIAVGGMVGGLVFASLTAPRFRLSAGDAAILNSGMVWGSGIGLLFFVSFDENLDLFAPLTLAGLNLGLVSSATLASKVEVSRRRVALVDLAGVGGGIAGFALGKALEAQDERTAHVALVGVGTGLIAGTLLTRFLDEPETPISVAPATGVALDSSGTPTTTLGARVTF